MAEQYRFLVIGAGGIGSWLAEGLVRMLEWRAPNSALVIVDGDNFEAKNKERQNFKGQGNKAEVLANQLVPEFPNTFIVPLPQWVVAEMPEEEAEEVNEDGSIPAGKITASDLLDEGDVVFAVVDNYKARADICIAAQSLDNIDVFLGGNDDGLFGTVYHYRRRNGEDVTEHPSVRHDEYVNPPDRNPGEMSCQERAEIEGGTQLIAANMGVTAYLLAQTQARIIDNEPIEGCEIYFDLNKGLAQAYDRRTEQELATVATV